MTREYSDAGPVEKALFAAGLGAVAIGAVVGGRDIEQGREEDVVDVDDPALEGTDGT